MARGWLAWVVVVVVSGAPSAAQAERRASEPDGRGRGAAAVGPGVAASVERFVRAQMDACNASRQTYGEVCVFAPGTPVRVVRPLQRGFYLVEIGNEPVAVHPRRRRIQSTRGPRQPLPARMIFCPTPVWVGPAHD